mgnify:CR=1 FL=1
MDTIHTIGRRKASVARIYLNKGKGAITINKKDYKDFFPVEGLQKKVLQPFSVLDLEGKFDVKVNVNVRVSVCTNVCLNVVIAT